VAGANESVAARLAARLGKIAIAGSDSHTIAGVGHTYTEVPGARTWMNFSPGCGQAAVAYTASTELRQAHGRRLQHRAVAFLANPGTLALSPLAVLVPAFTAGHWLNEIRFAGVVLGYRAW